MVTILLKKGEIKSTTLMGGNVDPNRYIQNIEFVQNLVLEPLLGTELFDKIVTDYENDTLAGDYLTLYEDFIVFILKYEALAEYVEVSNYLVENGGTFKHTADNREIVDKQEILFLSGKYREYAQTYVDRFYKWICKNPLTEYNTCQDGVNAQKVKTTQGWYL